MTQWEMIRLVGLIMVLFLVLPGFLYYTRGLAKAVLLRNIAIWLALALVIGFLYRTFGSS